MRSALCFAFSLFLLTGICQSHSKKIREFYFDFEYVKLIDYIKSNKLESEKDYTFFYIESLRRTDLFFGIKQDSLISSYFKEDTLNPYYHLFRLKLIRETEAFLKEFDDQLPNPETAQNRLVFINELIEKNGGDSILLKELKLLEVQIYLDLGDYILASEKIEKLMIVDSDYPTVRVLYGYIKSSSDQSAQDGKDILSSSFKKERKLYPKNPESYHYELKTLMSEPIPKFNKCKNRMLQLGEYSSYFRGLFTMYTWGDHRIRLKHLSKIKDLSNDPRVKLWYLDLLFEDVKYLDSKRKLELIEFVQSNKGLIKNRMDELDLDLQYLVFLFEELDMVSEGFKFYHYLENENEKYDAAFALKSLFITSDRMGEGISFFQDRMLKSNTEDSKSISLFCLGDLYFRTKNYKKLIDLFELNRELEELGSLSSKHLIESYYNLEEYEKAFKLIEVYQTNRPREEYSYTKAFDIAVRLGEKDAEKHLHIGNVRARNYTAYSNLELTNILLSYYSKNNSKHQKEYEKTVYHLALISKNNGETKPLKKYKSLYFQLTGINLSKYWKEENKKARENNKIRKKNGTTGLW